MPASSSGDNAVLYMKGDFSSYDDYDDYYYSNSSEFFDRKAWEIHSNEFGNPFSLYEMSTAGISTTEAFIINATNNYFTLTNGVNATSSLIDGRLFDDDEGGSIPEILFEPFLTTDVTFTCPSNCTENGICVFPGVCICKGTSIVFGVSSGVFFTLSSHAFLPSTSFLRWMVWC